MAIATLQIPSTANINNSVDPSQWSQLANLGNVYRQAQEDSAKRATLAQLGQGVDADAATLLHSNVPSLAQIGLNMQQSALNRQREDARNAVQDTHWASDYKIREAAARRAQEASDQADEDRTNAGKGYGAYFDYLMGRGAAPAASAGAAPFPAPLPGALQGGAPVAPPVQAGPPAAPQAPPPVAPAQPSAWQGTPIVPGGLQPGPAVAPQIPVKAQDDDTGLPGWVQSAVAQPPDTSAVARATTNLTAGHPVAAAGLNHDDIVKMAQNPITRPLAQAIIGKMTNPGEWTYHVDNDTGRVIATNSLDPNMTKFVSPPSAGGAPPATKEQRERDARFADAKARGYDNDTSNFYALNGKLPKDDLSNSQQKRVDTLTDQTRVADRVLDGVKQLRTASQSAWGFTGAGPASLIASTILPNSLASASGAVDTQDLINAAHTNVANVAKTYFGSRISNLDVNLLKELESSANEPDIVRQKIYNRADTVFNKIRSEDAAEAEGIRNRTWYKPGGGDPAPAPTAASAPAPTAAAPAAAPALGEFMKRARVANPGASDGDLARYWKDKYGG